MASEYTLKLKAVLDSSQVQQELQKLRQQQQQVLGGQNAKTPNQTNLGSLNSVLSRLNASINQLNRAIQQLNTSAKISNVPKQTSNPSMPIVGFPGSSSGLLDAAVNKTVLETVLKFKKIQPGAFSRMFNGGINGTGGWESTAFVKALGIQGTGMDYDTWERYFNNNIGGYRTALKNSVNPNFARQQQQRSFFKPMAGMFAHQAMPMVQQSLEAAGLNENLFSGSSISMGYGDMLGGVGKTLSYAAMGSAAGAPGMAVGAVVGLVETLFDAIAKGIRESQQEVDDWNRSVKEAADFRKSRDDFKKNTEIQNTLEGKNKNQLVELKERLQSEADADKNRLEMYDQMALMGQVAPDAKSLQAEYEKELATLKQIKATIKGIEDEEKNRAKQLKSLQNSAQKQLDQDEMNFYSISDRNAISKSLLSMEDNPMWMLREYGVHFDKAQELRKGERGYLYYLNKAKTSSNPKFAEYYLKQAEELKTAYSHETNRANAFSGGYVQLLEKLLSQLKAPDMKNMNSLANQGYMTYSGKDDQARLDMQFEYVKEQTNLQRQIRDHMDNLEINEFQ